MDSTITAIDGSAVGNPSALSKVYHDSNLSGSGTSASPLGLSSTIVLSSTGLPYTNEINTYSIYMHDQSSTSYVGLGYNYFQDSAGGETYIQSDQITIADSGTCTLTAKPESVEFFNGNDLDRFASYNLSGVVLSASGVNPVTSKLKDTRLSFYESGKPSAYYDRTGLQFGRTADVQTNLNSSLKFSYDVGGNLESTTYMHNGFSATTYTPTGTNQDTGLLTIYGISGVNSFGDYKIRDSWASAKRAQFDNSGNEKSVLDMYIGYNNGEQELYPAYIGFWNPYDGSAFIYQSSIVAWNNNLSAEHPVSAGIGLSGNGTSGSPLSVTGLSYDYTSIYQTSRTHISSNIDMTMDDNRHTTFSPYGVRIEETGSSPNHSSLAELSIGQLNMHDYDVSAQAVLSPTGLLLSDSANTVTIDASSWNSLTAWATAQGWTP